MHTYGCAYAQIPDINHITFRTLVNRVCQCYEKECPTQERATYVHPPPPLGLLGGQEVAVCLLGRQEVAVYLLGRQEVAVRMSPFLGSGFHAKSYTMYICTFLCAYVLTYVCMYICTYIQYVRMYVHTYMYVHAYPLMSDMMWDMFSCICTYVCTYSTSVYLVGCRRCTQDDGESQVLRSTANRRMPS